MSWTLEDSDLGAELVVRGYFADDDVERDLSDSSAPAVDQFTGAAARD